MRGMRAIDVDCSACGAVPKQRCENGIVHRVRITEAARQTRAINLAHRNSPPDYTVRYRRAGVVNRQRVWAFDISDARGHVVMHGWSSGTRSDAEIYATDQLRELRAKKATP